MCDRGGDEVQIVKLGSRNVECDGKDGCLDRKRVEYTEKVSGDGNKATPEVG